MGTTGAALVDGVTLTNATATYYTATNVSARVDKATIANFTAGAVTATLYKVPSGGSADTTNILLDGVSIGAHATYTCPEFVGHWLKPGETIQAKASALASLSLMVSGIETTT